MVIPFERFRSSATTAGPPGLFFEKGKLLGASVSTQLIPVVSSLSPLTTIFPLALVLAITAIKDAIDDIKRCRSDNEVNKRPALVLRGQRLEQITWDKVQVGDIIYLSNDELVTSDLLLISTSEPSSLCYIETAELDGETNLKVKQALSEMAVLSDDLRAISKFDGIVRCESPNNRLTRFEGSIEINGTKLPLNDTNILLRVICCFTLSVGTMIFEGVTGFSFKIYAPWENFGATQGRVGGSIVIGLLNTLSYTIILNTVVPISLYVSIEIIRLFQSKMIDWDLAMYYEPDDIAAKARTTTLNEELGKVQYIFSDKTGTLTQNVMTFNCCSIAGTCYGLTEDDLSASEEESNEVTTNAQNELPKHPFLEDSFKWKDKRLIDAIERQDEKVVDFMLNLALCHTVMCELKKGVLTYQAQSPDEGALVSAARNFGVVFKGRTSNSINVNILGKEVTFDVLNILDFNNERKRMSIIVRQRDSSQVFLYCKGADSIIKSLLGRGSYKLWNATDEHMTKFGTIGLRTLCLAKKRIDNKEYEIWNKNFTAAALSLEDREAKLSKVYNEIETDLELMGATAIEDKLQQGVSGVIVNLMRAEIRIWVLTGDKMETAINIGLSCRLLSDAMDLHTLEGENADDLALQLTNLKEYMTAKVRQMYSYYDTFPWDWLEFTKSLGEKINSPSDGFFDGFALAISGNALLYALDPKCERNFVDIACFCKAVICCRVTPSQKAQVVELIRKYKRAITLAIGDGANDVSMIQRANVGIGIAGKEGTQAVLASDYSLAQFRYLERLLLVHGRWSYLRICKFLKYFFYKNFAFSFCNFWFAFFCGMSAQTLFDPFFIATYNVIFTSMPVFALGILDQDINAKNSLRSPHLYPFGQNDEFFNWKVFIYSITYGIMTSLAIFFSCYLSFVHAILPNGVDEADLQSFGCAVAITLTIVVNLEICLETYSWTVIINCARFHLFSERFYETNFHPNKIDEMRYKQKYGVVPKPKDVKIRSRLRLGRRWFRSGYAFSSSEGIGNMIKAGVMFKKVFEALEPKQYESPAQYDEAEMI
ncbi:hypothetical protein ACOME3_009232 [Neoechinorhynchus agilis]